MDLRTISTRIKRYVNVESQEVKEGLGTTKAPTIDVMRKEGSEAPGEDQRG